MNGIKLNYILNQEITRNRHVEGQVAESRIRLYLLKLISDRDWGADANTHQTTYISLVRPILEYEIPIYACSSKSNLNKLEGVQLSSTRIFQDSYSAIQRTLCLFPYR
ncbi:uncharacterized protein TNCT_424941 [Trichonephila clavata]|uniref:Uncharacterized protein n=1 Tax=Trichonephila clavata TaxID=2740835 RepID=A0A8X6I920_TRICU|nr:uncharacterized protein TNCT_424941 [Trichonephila clavata]